MTPDPAFPRSSGDIEPPDLYGSVDRACRVLWRWRLLFMTVVGAVLIVGMLVLMLLPVRYTAEALIMVGVREPNLLVSEQLGRGGPPRQVDVDSAIQLLTSVAALREVAKSIFVVSPPADAVSALHPAMPPSERAKAEAAGSPDAIAERLRQHLAAERVQGSTLIKISYSDPDPAMAAKVANAVAGTAVFDRRQLASLPLAERANFDLVTTWVATPAVVPSTASMPNTRLIGLLIAVFALGAGCTAVSLANYYARRTILTPDHMARAGVRNLGIIPDFGSEAANEGAVASIFKDNATGIFTDAIAGLHASLMPLVPSYRCGPHATPAGRNLGLVLLFASSLPSEGKSTTLAALGTSLAGAGNRVLLIDADLRSPKLHRLLGVAADVGLSNCLDGGIDLCSLTVAEPLSGLYLLPAGDRHPRPLDILNSAELRRAVTVWRSSFDFILIDSPPVLSVADSRIIAALADYCIFIARWRRTGWEVVRQGLQLLADTGCPIAGVTISQVDLGQFKHYAYPAPVIYGGINPRPAIGKQES
jgi:capsular exopolysaccharide synthesis family protein